MYESTLLKMPHCWKSHVAAHFIVFKAVEMLHQNQWHSTATIFGVNNTYFYSVVIEQLGSGLCFAVCKANATIIKFR